MGSIPGQGIKIPHAAWPIKERGLKTKKNAMEEWKGSWSCTAGHLTEGRIWAGIEWQTGSNLKRKKKKRRSGKVDHCHCLSWGLAQRGTSRRAFVLLWGTCWAEWDVSEKDSFCPQWVLRASLTSGESQWQTAHREDSNKSQKAAI